MDDVSSRAKHDLSSRAKHDLSSRAKHDVVVLGGGSAGEAVARDLTKRGCTVALVEDGLVGGECPYLACMPSKAMLHAARLGRSWEEAVGFRDEVAEHRDDSATAKGLAEAGITLVRERGVIAGAGSVHAGTRTLEAEHVVVCTGAEARPPRLDGIDDVDFWTSDDALSSAELPGTLLVLGGGPVGCELAQVYARFGARVTLVETAPRLLSSEPEFVGELVAAALADDGVDVRTGVKPTRVVAADGAVELSLEDGAGITAARLLVATGKKPRVEGIGLESVGVQPDDSGALAVDDRCRVVDGLWAAGDVTGVAPFTHTANYQAKIVATNITGGERRADTRAIPRAIYTDPAVFCVGDTSGNGARIATLEVEETARAIIDERRDGRVTAYAVDNRLVGAAVVGPDADHWAAELTLAVRAGVDLDVLADVVHAFPTFPEAFEPVYAELAARQSREEDR